MNLNEAYQKYPIVCVINETEEIDENFFGDLKDKITNNPLGKLLHKICEIVKEWGCSFGKEYYIKLEPQKVKDDPSVAPVVKLIDGALKGIYYIPNEKTLEFEFVSGAVFTTQKLQKRFPNNSALVKIYSRIVELLEDKMIY